MSDNMFLALIQIFYLIILYFNISNTSKIEDKKIRKEKLILNVMEFLVLSICHFLIMLNIIFVKFIYIFVLIYLFFKYVATVFKNIYYIIKKEEKITTLIKSLISVIIIQLLFIDLISSFNSVMKPVIYIYPEKEIEVSVTVDYPEKLTCTYPKYEEGWRVIATPEGNLTDIKTGRKLYCLYWEGTQKRDYKFNDGFLVAGEDSASFLEEKLEILGLNEREANEFIIYWLPKLEKNKYNLIRFETQEEIEKYMPLNITPKPDTIIRIFMDYKALNNKVEIEEQKLITPLRKGYTVVEWGGTEF